jgi:hypothetical protein
VASSRNQWLEACPNVVSSVGLLFDLNSTLLGTGLTTKTANSVGGGLTGCEYCSLMEAHHGGLRHNQKRTGRIRPRSSQGDFLDYQKEKAKVKGNGKVKATVRSKGKGKGPVRRDAFLVVTTMNVNMKKNISCGRREGGRRR